MKVEISLDDFARSAYAAVPEFISVSEAEEAILKEARRKHYDAQRAEKLCDALDRLQEVRR